MDYKKVGERIKRERKRRNLTQRQLAEIINISDTYMAQIENARRHTTLNILTKLSQYFNVSIDTLLFECVEPSDPSLYQEWQKLMQDRTNEEKLAAIKMVKAFFENLDAAKK